MAKKSQRRPLRRATDQSGCMWGIINMFDFRQGPSSQRLISDKKHATTDVAGPAIPRNKLETLTSLNENSTKTDTEEKKTLTVDSCKLSIKKLMEEEMFSEEEINKAKVDGEVEPKELISENGSHKKKNDKRIKRIRSRSCDSIRDIDVVGKPRMECPCHQRSANSLDLDNITEQFFQKMHKKSMSFDRPSEANSQFNQNIAEKLSEAIKLLISQKLLDRKDLLEDGDMNIRASKELMDVLQILISDEDLFLSFSKDPKSLLAKYLQNEMDNKVEEDGDTNSLGGFSDGEISNLRRSDKLVNRKYRNFFRRKVKSQGSSPLKDDEDSQSSKNIVLLKPGLTTSSNPQRESPIVNKEPNEKIRPIFFLAELKRRLKNAMHHRIPSVTSSKRFSSESQNSSDTNGSFKENSGMTKDHFFVERIVRPNLMKKGDKTDNLKGHKIGINHDSITMSHSRHRISNIYMEAKKHLSEILSHGDKDVVNSNKRLPKTLGRVLSLPEYNASPVESPRRKTQNLEPQSSVTDETADVKVQVMDSIMYSSDETTHYDEAGGSCSTMDKIISEDDVPNVEITEIVVQEESNALDAHSEKNGLSIVGEDQTADESEVDEQRDSTCMNEDSYEENKIPASPSNASMKEMAEDCERAADILERPSPVSVLEPIFVEDDISPAWIRSQSAETPIRSLHIQFEESGSLVAKQTAFSKTFAEGNESVLNYVKSVLEVSGLTWDELYVKSLSSEQLLDPYLINRVEYFTNQLCHDQNLLFDCINEALTELYAHYFGCSLSVSFIRPNIRPLPSMKDAIREVCQGVKWHINPLPLPRTLDQIVRKDMAKSGSWMDLRFDADSFGCEMCEAVLEDLMEDTILSFVNHHEEKLSIISCQARG
ncbi:hypothetical protein ACFE04_026617 [Oxalis oulophora]